MKCPKCGYNSFEYLNSCKKCGAELSSFKRNMGISPIIFKRGAPAVNASTDETIVDLTEDDALHVASAETSTIDNDNFTWDTPTEDASVESDQPFAGFDSDVVKENLPTETATTEDDDFKWDVPIEETPVESGQALADFSLDAVEEELSLETAPETLSFNEQPEAATLATPEEKTEPTLDEFSFYEETIDLEEKQLFTEQSTERGGDAFQASGNDIFGETGIIGELLPEQLQQDIVHDDAGSASAEYEHEFNLESIAGTGEGKSVDKEKATSRESYDFSDFEKEFELIFNEEESAIDSKKK